MAETWPASLQQKMNRQGLAKSFGETTITTNVDVGKPKKRARFTKGIDTYQLTIFLNFDDYSTFDTFYKTTLSNGVKTFNFEDPFTQSTKEFQFVNPPSVTPIGNGGVEFNVSMEWREIP